MIIVEDYNPEWAQTFAELRAIYLNSLQDLIISIEHVGSTSVPGLAAKPVIDIDIVIESQNQLMPVIENLKTLGYHHVGDLGITGREAFKRLSDLTPEDGSLRIWPKHNLYVCQQDSISLQNHVLLRNFLLTNYEQAKEYSQLKRQLATQYPEDIDKYIEGKTSFIINILRSNGINESNLQSIINQNKASK